MTNTVNIRILDKEYQVNCPPEEQSALLQSAQILDARMREIRKSGHVIGLDRIAVMAALNLTYDLLQAQKQVTVSDSVSTALDRMHGKLSDALDSLQAPKA